MTGSSAAVHHPGELGVLLLSSSETGSTALLEDRPAAPPAVITCSERLPRDVLLRLAAVARQVDDIRQEHAVHPDLSRRLDHVATDLEALIQSIYEETVLHLTGRRT